MIWITADDVIMIHSRIIQVTGGIDGLRDRAGLEAAIAAPLQSFGVLQTKVNSRSEKSPAKFARPKEGITKLAGEKTHRQPE